MNIDRLTEIAEWLEAGAPEKKGITEFNMTGFIEEPRAHDCGTACCIAGAAIQFAQDDPFTYDKWLVATEEPFEWAQKLIDLSESQGFALFYCEDEDGETIVSQRDIDPQWAARCIRKLIATGEVDWLGTRYAKAS